MSDMPEEEAEISLDEVSDDERPLVKEGAVFLLHVGYATSEFLSGNPGFRREGW